MPARFIRAAAASAACLTASLSFGHGTPIVVDGIDNALTVSHPADGYPRFVFGQQAEEGDPQGPINLPGRGPTLLWELPGMDITNNLANAANLSLEVLAPRGIHATPQTLWYWDPTTESVEPSGEGAELQLVFSDGPDLSLKGSDTTAPTPRVLADPVAGQTGFHNHGLLNYAMPYDANLATGLYGYFGRFDSDSYAPSESFLTIFNVGVAYEDMAPASEAIWGAAFPGDYDHNGQVNLEDHATWTTQYGTTPAFGQVGADGNGNGVVDAADYTVWRDARASSSATLIPEASTLLSVLGAILSRAIFARNAGRRNPGLAAR